MRTQIAILAAALAFPSATVLAQGPLDPPAGPPLPTMKTLDQVEPRKPVTAPATISEPGSYYLTANATVTGSGITITSSDVALDLCGFTIAGDGGQTDYGVLVLPPAGTIRNISVRNGIFFNLAGAVIVDGADDVVIEHNQMKSSTRTGIWLAGACKGALIRHNLLVDCIGGLDITAFTGDTISGVTIEHNTVSGGNSEGVDINAQTSGAVRFVTVAHNRISDKSGTAMTVAEAAGGVAERLIFDSNHCSGNGNLGMILPADTQSLVVRNFFVNLTLSTLTATGNTIGPIVSTAGTLGTTGADISPWANIRN